MHCLSIEYMFNALNPFTAYTHLEIIFQNDFTLSIVCSSRFGMLIIYSYCSESQFKCKIPEPE